MTLRIIALVLLIASWPFQTLALVQSLYTRLLIIVQVEP